MLTKVVYSEDFVGVRWKAWKCSCGSFVYERDGSYCGMDIPGAHGICRPLLKAELNINLIFFPRELYEG